MGETDQDVPALSSAPPLTFCITHPGRTSLRFRGAARFFARELDQQVFFKATTGDGADGTLSCCRAAIAKRRADGFVTGVTYFERLFTTRPLFDLAKDCFPTRCRGSSLTVGRISNSGT